MQCESHSNGVVFEEVLGLGITEDTAEAREESLL